MGVARFEKLRNVSPKTWLRLTALAVFIPAVVIVVNLHWFFIQVPNAVGFDDGAAAALGQRVAAGHWLPYVDGCSHRGPLLYWLMAVVEWLSGSHPWLGIRIFMLLVGLLTAGALFGTGLAAKKPIGGAAGALVWIYFWLAGETASAFAVTGEAIAAAFGLVAVMTMAWALLSAQKLRSRIILLALSGAFAACAGMVKQTAFAVSGPLALWALAGSLSLEGESRRARWTLLLSFFGGIAATVAIILLRYVIAGQLKAFWYWFYVYNAKIYMGPYKNKPFKPAFLGFFRGHTWAIGALVIVSIWGLARPIGEIKKARGILRGYADAGLEVTASLLLLLVFAAVSSPQRFWPPYYVMVYPFVGLLVGVRVGELAEKAQGTLTARIISQLVLGALLASFVGWTASWKLDRLVAEKKKGDWKAAQPDPLCATIDKYSKPGDRLFIWGFDSRFNVTCHRVPATRFAFMTLVAGAVPPFWKDLRKDRIARDARKDLMADLEASKPPVILDITGKMRGVSLRVVPELSRYVDGRYCPMGVVRSKDGTAGKMYVRKGIVDCTPRPPPLLTPNPIN